MWSLKCQFSSLFSQTWQSWQSQETLHNTIRGWVLQYSSRLANWLVLNWWSAPLNPNLIGIKFLLCVLFCILADLNLRYDASIKKDLFKVSSTWPVVLKPNSRGQETAKARTHTVAIITKTLFLERWVVLYRTGITTAVYLHTHTHTQIRVRQALKMCAQGIGGDIWVKRKVLK